MLKQDIIERLCRLDEDADLLFDGEERFRLVIVGGGALVLMECLTRATHDIDALNASGKIRGLLENYDINCDVQTYINNFPYNYEDRLIKLDITSKKIDFFTASLEDIVIAKLFSYRDSDVADVESETVLKCLDWAKLQALIENEDEIKRNALNDRCYQDFRYNYENYVRRWRP